MSDGPIRLEVIYALAHEQHALPLTVPAGTTVREAIERSGVLQHHPDIDLTRNKVGRWNRVVALDDAVADGDRIEIYRALQVDPKESRRARAAKTRKAG
ncbi:MAG TPA: RnfH family protein [Fontimonas sp.]